MGRESTKFTRVDDMAFWNLKKEKINIGAFAMYCLLTKYEFTFTNPEAKIDGHPCRWFFKRDKDIAEDMGGISLNSVSRYREELKKADLIYCDKGIEPPDKYPEYPPDYDRTRCRYDGIPVMWYCLRQWEEIT